MTDEFDPDHVADALRASLRRHARQAPDGELLSERIIHAAERSQPASRPPGRRWRTWALPLVAAAAVAGVVAAVVGIESYHPDSRPSAARPPSGHRIAASVAESPATSTAPGPTGSTTGPASINSTPIDTSSLHGVQVIDLTFAGSDDGWALSSADCIQGPGRCTALLRTTDGHRWTSMPGPAFNVPGVEAGCATSCVEHLRFATDKIGYAWGAGALFMTTDGGRSWTSLPGGATGLETLDGVVVRLRAGANGEPCASTCRVETAPIGSRDWTARTLPVDAVDLDNLGFAGNTVVMTALRGPADTDLLVSTDHGRTWVDRGRPCVSSLIHLSGAPDGSIAAECAPHQGGSGEQAYTTVSEDGGRSFGAQRRAPRQEYSTSFVAVSARTQLISYDAAGQRGVLYRSSDGARSWQVVRTAGRASIDAPYEVYGVREFLGFESPSTGRWVSGDQRVIATTRDGGKTWTETSLG